MAKNPFDRPSSPEGSRTEREPPLRYASIEALGSRKEQQDAHAVRRFERPSGPVDLVVVADGHGGKGRAAARIVADIIPLSFEERGGFNESGLRAAFKDAHLAVVEETESDGATATAVLVGKRKALVGWAGNCQAGAFSDGGLRTLIVPHEYGEHAGESERLTEMGALVASPSMMRPTTRRKGYVVHEGKYLEVTRSVGDADMDPFVLHEPEIARVTFGPDDRFLIVASDGFWNLVRDDARRTEAQEALRESTDPEDAKRRLASLIDGWKPDDNTTVVIVEIPPRT